MVGKSLGHYEILEPLGSGGMGDVYRAHDSSLNRDVAIKVLPEDLADDPDRLARLKREAHLLAALNHPNVATIHGFEESDGTRFLVMELVKGESLEQRLAGGPLPVDDALDVCRQIAEALAAAHAEDIIHRDLKPANILVTPDGRAKVLDFGIAKTVASTTSAVDVSQAPGFTVAATQDGVILGTAPYMSPEQVRGHALDKRTDIWAFGCVLFEALTGQGPFNRETLADTLAATLEIDPAWDALPAATPAGIQSLLRRCLQKDPNGRLHDIADARIEIEAASGERQGQPARPGHAAAPAPTWRRALPWAVTLLTATVAIAAIYSALNRPADRVVRRFTLVPPAGERLLLSDDPGIAVSPDGSHVAYMTEGGLFVQAIDQTEARVIPGTVGTHSPFFSPDGEWVGFFDDADRTLKKVQLLGGPARLVCDAPGAHSGASWGPDETIVFSSVGSGLGLVSSSGDTAQSLTTADEAAGEVRHEYPEVLPNGKGVLFTIESEGSRAIAVLDLDTNHYETIVPAGTGAHYTPTGHVVYGQAGALMAVPFDQDLLEVTGTPFQLHERVRTTSDGSLDLSFSRDGMLAYVPAVPSTGSTRLVWADDNGDVSLIFAREGDFNEARLSPDGQHVALHGEEDVLWLYDIPRDVLSVLSSDGRSFTPTWSSDGEWVYYSFREGADADLYRKPSDLSGPAELVLSKERDQYVPSVSFDGSTLLYVEVDLATGFDIWALPLEGDQSPRPIVQTPAAELRPQISPDGAWFAYVSDTSGVGEVYVRSLAGATRQWQLSNGGGRTPRWSHDGRAVFYSEGPRVMRVDIPDGAEGEPGAPTLVFENDSLVLEDVAPDGRFLMTERDSEPPAHLSVVLNWFEELRRLAPTGR